LGVETSERLFDGSLAATNQELGDALLSPSRTPQLGVESQAGCRYEAVRANAGRSSVASLTFENIVKDYPTRTGFFRAVHELNLHIADREFVVLVGPSGCGKTTTLRLVAGLEDPDQGRIHIGDRIVNDVAPRDRDVAMVFQNYALYPHMTVFKNMAFALKLRRLPKDEIKKRVHAVAELLGLETLLDRRPGALSGGERQRVAVGRAIVREPKVFLFDEPLSNLDAKLRMHMRTELKALHQRICTTMVYVTHDQEEAMTLGDRLVVMRSGVMRQCGTPLQVYNQPDNRFVAGFIGRPPMNFLEGRLEGREGRLSFVDPCGICVVLPAQYEKAGLSVGDEVVLGVRPEHLRLVDSPQVPEGPPAVDGIAVSVSVVEPLGDRLHVHGVTDGNSNVTVQLPPTVGVRPGDRLSLRVDPGDVHLFRADGEGRRIVPVSG